MQRDIGNEIIVAIVVVGVLAFALTSAIILSLSGGSATTAETATPASTEIALATERTTPESTTEPTATLTEEPLPIDATETSVVTETATRPATTAAPSVTPSPSSTSTATASPVPPSSATSVPTVTLTLTATASRTSVPTATLTLTSTLRPSSTLTATRRPTATASTTPAPPATPLPTATEPPPSTSVFCIAPFGWRLYEVQAGDTLSSIARATGSAAFDIQVANCLSGANAVAPGDVIYVPRLPGEPVRTVVPGQSIVESEPVGELRAVGCSDTSAQITIPRTGDRVSGRFEVRGTAGGNGFSHYLLEVRSDFVTVYTQYLRGEKVVSAGILGVIDSSVFTPGIYWIRLSVVDQAGAINTARCAVPVYFE